MAATIFVSCLGLLSQTSSLGRRNLGHLGHRDGRCGGSFASRRCLIFTATAAMVSARPLGAWAKDRKLDPMFIRFASPQDIALVFRTLEQEPGGESMSMLRSVIKNEEWQSVSQYARLYDTFLRKDVMVPLAGRLGPSKQAADGIAAEVLETFKGIDRAARKQDGGRALALCDRLEELINRFVLLAPTSSEAMRLAEARKLGL